MSDTATHWETGDALTLRAHTSERRGLGYGGLSYRGGEVIAGEAGAAGGWDVYDVAESDRSFYGFSVTHINGREV